MIVPTALHRLANNEHGELATVRAAVACSTIMCVSVGASIRMELIAEEHRQQIEINYSQSTSQLWFQFHILKPRQYTQKLIERAERCGYKALVLTVDASARGNRECDVHNNFTLPKGIQRENMIDFTSSDNVKTYRQSPIDASSSWKDIDWIRSITSLPLIIKGIIHPDGARLAVTHGIQGIIVSNHGGRQLDTCQSTTDALPDIMDAISNEKHRAYWTTSDMGFGSEWSRRCTKCIGNTDKRISIGYDVMWLFNC